MLVLGGAPQLSAGQAQKTTPVDLTVYASSKVQTEERLVANGGRVVVTRRPMVDLWATAPATSVPDPGGEGDVTDDEAGSPLDVPAFLRRQEG